MLRVAGCGLRVAGCGLRVAGCGLRVAGCGLRVAGCGLRVAGCGLRVAGCGLRVAGCGLRVAGCGLRGCGLRVAGCGLRVLRVAGCGKKHENPHTQCQEVSPIVDRFSRILIRLSCPLFQVRLCPRTAGTSDHKILRHADVSGGHFGTTQKRASVCCSRRSRTSRTRASWSSPQGSNGEGAAERVHRFAAFLCTAVPSSFTVRRHQSRRARPTSTTPPQGPRGSQVRPPLCQAPDSIYSALFSEVRTGTP